MSVFIRQGCWLALAVLPCVTAAGCKQEKLVIARGRVTCNGQPLQVKDAPVLGRVAVSFIPVSEELRTRIGPQSALVNQEDGTFTVGGADGRGIPPSQYRIAVYQYDPYPTDQLKGRFREDSTQILREVTGEGDIEIDVSKLKG